MDARRCLGGSGHDECRSKDERPRGTTTKLGGLLLVRHVKNAEHTDT